MTSVTLTDPPEGWKLLTACAGEEDEVLYILASPGNAGDNESVISMELYRASMEDGTIKR